MRVTICATLTKRTWLSFHNKICVLCWVPCEASRPGWPQIVTLLESSMILLRVNAPA